MENVQIAPDRIPSIKLSLKDKQMEGLSKYTHSICTALHENDMNSAQPLVNNKQIESSSK